MTDLQIWEWTLTKESIAPCFVRDVLAMRQSNSKDTDFFWLGHMPCRTVLLVGMIVAIQVYDKRTIYTVDDGTAVIDCVLRHANPTFAAPAPAPRLLSKPTGGLSAKANSQPSSPKKPRLDKSKSESTEPPVPITEPGYPVRVVGKVVRHYESKQIHADTINPCPSSLDEITHLERVIELHKTKYSLADPFILPPKPTSRTSPSDSPPPPEAVDVDASVFSNSLAIPQMGPSTTSYALPAPPRMPLPLQNRNKPPSVSLHARSSHHEHTHVPSSPIASSIASSTPSSPCKSSSPTKAHEVPRKPKLRHPSRLHTRDLTANTFRLYVKHYMDNAPPPFPALRPSPSWSLCGGLKTPTKRVQDDGGGDESTPRLRQTARNETRDSEEEENTDGPTLGFTLSHLRRVPELALLAARVVRAETRKRDKADRGRERANSRIIASTSAPLGRTNGRENERSTDTPRAGAAADPPRKKIARLFSWAVVKLYEEGSIILWDGEVRPLPVPPSLLPLLPQSSGSWKNDTQNAFGALFASWCEPSTPADMNASVLYNLSASGSLYSHYHPPRQSTGSGQRHHQHEKGSGRGMDIVDADADPAYLSDPLMDEEAYVPLTRQLLADCVGDAVGALRRGRSTRGSPRAGRGGGAPARGPTPEDVLAYLKRTDGKWARVGVWAVEEALAVLKEE